MFKKYIKIAIRNIKRNKGYSAINLSGLAVGMVVCILIMMWVVDEISYDTYHKNAENIYRVCIEASVGRPLRAPVTMSPAAPYMVDEFPEVINAVRVVSPGKATVKYKMKEFEEEFIGYADNSFFDIFTINFISGDPKTALKSAYSAVITEDMAKKYFGNEEALGKIILIEGNKQYAVTGVIQNVPRNSHFTFNILRSFETLLSENPRVYENWMNIHIYTYILLTNNSDYKELEKKFPSMIDKHLGPVLSKIGGSIKLFLQPLTSIHLYSDFESDIAANGDIMYVIIFSGVAIFVLLIACINFINLSTARATSRLKEIGLRKTIGADRTKLIIQFFTETFVFAFLSILLALLLIWLVLPLFNEMVGYELNSGILLNPWIIFGFIIMVILVTIFAGFYPAIYLSSFQPAAIIKNSVKGKVSIASLRSALVVTQFIISVILIVASMTIYKQVDYMKNKNLGFDKEHILIIPGVNEKFRESYSFIKNELLNIQGILSIGGSSIIPGSDKRVSIFQPEGFSPDETQAMDYLDIDPDYLKTMKIEIASGRMFLSSLASDSSESVMINETAARKFGWSNPIGKTFIFNSAHGSNEEIKIMNVIGVVKDFHTTTLHRNIEPQIIFYDLENIENLIVRISPENISHTIDELEVKWAQIAPDIPFNYFFFDEYFDGLYHAEERVGKLIFFFSLLAIFIGCLGLFGMAAFTAEQRTKEIGIRKVLGASILNVVRLLSKDYITLIIVANIIAWPISWFLLNKWLENFAYKDEVAFSVFLYAGIIAIILALFTVSSQAFKVAKANPIKALKYE